MSRLLLLVLFAFVHNAFAQNMTQPLQAALKDQNTIHNTTNATYFNSTQNNDNARSDYYHAPKNSKVCYFEKDARTSDATDYLVGKCLDRAKLPGVKVLVQKSAHNCNGRLYQCNRYCASAKNRVFSGKEGGICIF